MQIQANTDYSFLYTIIYLIDLCINDRIYLDEQEILQLKLVMSQLNNQIREIRGYDLLVSRVKEMLISIITKWSLLLNPHKKKLKQQTLKFSKT